MLIASENCDTMEWLHLLPHFLGIVKIIKKDMTMFVSLSETDWERDGLYKIYSLFDCKGSISLSLAKQTHMTSQLRGHRILSDLYIMVVCVITLGPKGFGFISRGDKVINRCDISSSCLSDLVEKDHEISYLTYIKAK